MTFKTNSTDKLTKTCNEEFLGRSGNFSYFQMGGGIKKKGLYNKKNGKPSKEPGVAALREDNDEEISVLDNLKERGVDLNKTYVITDIETNVATFLLYNLSGQLIGYQQYNPNSKDKKTNHPRTARYFTYVSKYAKNIGVFGVDTIDKRNYLFITEGIFDAIKLHNLGLPAVAVLSNHTKILRSWFKALNKTTIVICDNDDAGRKLASIGKIALTTPAPYKDLGEMPQDEIKDWLSKELKVS